MPPTRPTATASTGRASAPAQTQTPRPTVAAAPAKGPLAAVLSWRVLVMAGVIGLAFALVMPSVRVFLQQERDQAELKAERDAAQQEVDELNAQLERWKDPAFVMAQARERLAYVMPGETPYRVVDPEFAMPAAQGSIDAQNTGQEPSPDVPWFETLWNEIERTAAAAPSTEPEQTSRAPLTPANGPEPTSSTPPESPLGPVELGG